MGCFFAYEGEMPGIFDGAGVMNAHFANASFHRIISGVQDAIRQIGRHGRGALAGSGQHDMRSLV